MSEREHTIEDCEFVDSERVEAGGKIYETDCVVLKKSDDDAVYFNHIEHPCPNCGTIDNMAIEWSEPTMQCYICDYSRLLEDTDLASITLIEDQPAPSEGT